MEFCSCRCCAAKQKHRFIPVESHSADMSVIYISSTMIWDHLPDRYVQELQILTQQFQSPVGSENTVNRRYEPVDKVSAGEREMLNSLDNDGNNSVK